MRVVIDTNVLVAAFIARGACSELLEHIALRHQAVISQPILDEFVGILERKFRFDRHQANSAAKLLKSKFELVKPAPLPAAVCRDSDDDVIIATAIAGNCDCIVSGDKDLLILEAYEGIKMISPTDFWKVEKDGG